MFENLMKNLLNERKKLIDKCIKELIESTGLTIPENPSNMDYAMLFDDLNRKGYKIKHEYNSVYNVDYIQLVKKEDLYEEIKSAYKISVKSDESSVSIVAEKVIGRV